jgi:hypothetical protein
VGEVPACLWVVFEDCGCEGHGGCEGGVEGGGGVARVEEGFEEVMGGCRSLVFIIFQAKDIGILRGAESGERDPLRLEIHTFCSVIGYSSQVTIVTFKGCWRTSKASSLKSFCAVLLC